MIKFIKRLFGYSCCGEWSSWEKKEHHLDRMVEVNYMDVWVPVIQYYRERHCLNCGKIQQKRLHY